jgi:hypothetical protein
LKRAVFLSAPERMLPDSVIAGTQFVSAFFFCIFVERISHVLVFFLVDTLLGVGEGGVKRLASINSIQELISWGLGLVYAVPGMLASLASYLLGKALYFAVILLLLALWIALFRSSAVLILDSIYVYNTRISPVLRAFVMVPLEYANLFITPFIAAYNAAVYTFQGLIQHVVFPALRSAPAPFLNAMNAFVDFVRELILSVVVYWGTLYGDCSTSGVVSLVLNATFSTDPTALTSVSGNEINCFEPGQRSLNLMSPMAKLRVFVGYAGIFSKVSCSTLSPVFDIVMYPFLDINTAKFVHNTVNALLFWVVHTPMITLARCEESRKFDDVNSWTHTMMCVPDLYPGFNMMISGVRALGRMIDNWLNTFFIIVSKALGLPVPVCNTVNLAFQKVTEDTLFGGNESRFVGLTTGSFAITDGVSTQYSLFTNTLTQVYAHENWPYPIDIKLGVAAVKYDSRDEIDTGTLQQTMSMMGCDCTDVPDDDSIFGTRMVITCAIARYEPEAYAQGSDTPFYNADEQIVPLDFALPSTARYMKCAETKIVVDSVRWPLYRLSIPDRFLNMKNMYDKFINEDSVDGPTEIDAMVWVMPACATDGVPSPACTSSFSVTACFPFCAAARLTGSRNNGMLLYSAKDWTEHIQLINRDCSATFSAESSNITYTLDEDLPSVYGGLISHNFDLLDGKTTVSGWDPRQQACVFSTAVQSRMLNTRDLGAELNDYKVNPLGSILLDEQPFAFAGDVVLTSVKVDGIYYVKVQRMYGLQGTSMFTLVTVNAMLRANAPCNTPGACDDSYLEGHVITPYSWFESPTNHNPAVASKWGVFFAVNPSLRMFSEFFKKCKNQTSTLQYSVTSSYGPIRIWRVDAYAYNDPLKAPAASTGMSVELENAFSGITDDFHCAQKFNVMVTSMEYLDDANIVVKVLYTKPSYYDSSTTSTWGNDPDDVVYLTYYLHPVKMLLRKDEMWVDDDAPALISEGLLCPAQRRMPEFGGMLAETTASVLFLSRLVTEFLTVVPLVFQRGVYREITTCLPFTRGHSFLRSCGQGFLDTDPFFGSLQRANHLLWNSLSKVGLMVSGNPRGDTVQQYLNGAAMFGAEKNWPLIGAKMAAYIKGVSMLSKQSMQSSVQAFSTVAGQPAMVRGLLVGSVGSVRAAAWFLSVLRKVLLETFFNKDPRVNLGTAILQGVYDSMDTYDTNILDSQRQSCVGIATMMGYSNPFAGLARETCQASALFQKGVLNVVLILFVDVPSLACLCQQDAAVDFKKNAMETCWINAPRHMQGVLRKIISEVYEPADLCDRMSDVVSYNLQNSMNDFVDLAYRSTEHVGNAVQYVFTTLERRLGGKVDSCTEDFSTNPYIVTIVPDPVDYWRICGTTFICRSKCRTEIEMFEYQRDNSLVRLGSSMIANIPVESQFFRDEDIVGGRSLAPFQILDMVELNDCNLVCGNDDFTDYHNKDRCISIVGISNSGQGFKVQVADYCIPAAMEAPVRQYQLWDIPNSETWVSDVRKIKFLHQGQQFCYLFDPDGACSLVVVFSSKVSLFRPDGVEYNVLSLGTLPSQLEFVTDVFVFTDQSIVIAGTGVSIDPQDSQAVIVGYKSYCIDARNPLGWNAYPMSTCNDQNVISYSEPAVPICVMQMGLCVSVLLLPAVQDSLILSCMVANPFTGSVTDRSSCIPVSANRDSSRSTGLQNTKSYGQISSRKSYLTSDTRAHPVFSSTVGYLGVTNLHYGILSANHPDKPSVWLTEMRLNVQTGDVLPSYALQLQASLTINSGCSLLNCMGCSGSVQRACFIAQQCTIVKCIGKTVNMRQPTCGMGAILADMSERVISYWHGSWLLIVDMLTTILNLSIADASTEGEYERTMLQKRTAKPKTPPGKAPPPVQRTPTGTTAATKTPTGTTAATKTPAATTTPAAKPAQPKKTVRRSLSKKVSLKGLNKMDVAFNAYICETKDIVLDICGMITSTINLFLSVISIPSNDPNSILLDQYGDATNSMLMSSVTFFLGQLSLGLLYPTIALKKAMLCRGTDLLAILDFRQLVVSVQEVETVDMNEAIAGRCLTSYYSEQLQESQSPGAGFRPIVSSMMSKSLSFLVSLPFGDIKHLADALLTYVISVIRGVQDLIVTADRKNCKIIDQSAANVSLCACGDTPVKIPALRATEGIQQSAFWCSGVLEMISPFGTPLMIFNPFTYQELVNEMNRDNRLDKYLKCISEPESQNIRDYSCAYLRPRLAVFELQGISTIAVLVRCKANYNNMQWDRGAALLFAEEIPVDLSAVYQEVTLARSMIELDVSPLALCMRNALSQNFISPDGCFQESFLYTADVKKDVYFRYEEMTDANTGSAILAACHVFTGPASRGVSQFTECMEGSIADDCQIQPFIWSGRSTNKVPVANAHSFVVASASKRVAIAQSMHADIHGRVLAELAKLGWTPDNPDPSWEGTGVEVSLFTSEGDLIHQAFDCTMLGPYGSVELWPSDIEGQLPTASYFRDTFDGATREFELPCSGDALRGDSKGPYTCGSNSRRSMIKYFLRNHTAISTESDHPFVKGSIVTAVNNNIKVAGSLFGINSYGCPCPASAPTLLQPQHVECCVMNLNGFDPSVQTIDDLPVDARTALLSSFIPEDIRNFVFASVQKQIPIADLVDAIMNYTRNDIWHDKHALLSYDSSSTDYHWDDQQKLLAADEGLFHTTEPIRGYSEEDVDSPLHTSQFEMCMGLISQVFFTIPVRNSDEYTREDGDFRDVPLTLDTINLFDPMTQSADEHLSYMESFVRDLVAGSLKKNPIHWSHTLRHMPSHSLVCEDPLPQDATSFTPMAVFSSEQYTAMVTEPGVLVAPVIEHRVNSVTIDDIVVSIPDSDADGVLFRSASSLDASIGAVGKLCFCGWSHTDVTPNGRRHCQVPSSLCLGQPWSSLGLAGASLLDMICFQQVGMYDHAEHDHALAVFLQSRWDESEYMSCPIMAPSSSWGVSNSSQMHAWLTGQSTFATVDVRDIALHGRDGLRMGNIAALLREYYLFFSPAQRVSPMYHTQEDQVTHAQKRCLSKDGSLPVLNDTTNTSGSNFSEYTRAWVDDLLPVVQGIEEQRAPAFCMRYVVELATLSVYRDVLGSTHITTEEQIVVTTSWKRKCKTQMKMLGFCSLRGVFSAVPRSAASDQSLNNNCPFYVAAIPSTHSVTIANNCMVAVVTTDNAVALYDPCRCAITDQDMGICHDVSVVSRLTLQTLLAQCQPMDPLALIGDTAKLHTLRWSSHEKDVGQWQERLDKEVTQLIKDTYDNYHKLNVLVDEVLVNGLVDMNFSTLWKDFVMKPQTTTSSAHLRKDDPQATCGIISDWWPDEWDKPVGFHPTVPCGTDAGRSKNAYRSFKNYMLYIDGVGMVYSHSALRNASRSHSTYGTAGVCRASNLLTYSRDLNNARICTQSPLLARVDYAVPILEESDSAQFHEEECSESMHDVPWDMKTSSNPAHAVPGLMTTWPAAVGSGGNNLWPSVAGIDDFLSMGLPEHLQSDSWSTPGEDSSCGMPPLLTCATDADCTGMSAHAEARSSSVKFKCFNQVCSIVRAPSAEWNSYGSIAFECAKHADCEEDFPGTLCSGEGRCVLPIVEVWNERSSFSPTQESIEVEWHSRVGQCDSSTSTPVDMFGHSVWGQVPDILQVHGMCSYRNWFEYNYMFKEGGQCGNDFRDVNAGTECRLQNIEEKAWPSTMVDTEPGPMFEKNMAYMEAHPCDRDYQHLGGFELCQAQVGANSAMLLSANQRTGEITELLRDSGKSMYGKLFRTYSRSSSSSTDSSDLSLSLVQMKHMNNLQAGWFGTEHSFVVDEASVSDTALGLKRCDSIPQCSLPEYTIQGRQIPVRRVGRRSEASFLMYTYKVKDAVFCGSFGKIGKTTKFEAQGEIEDFCTIDEAVLPMYQMLCRTAARTKLTQAGCNLLDVSELCDDPMLSQSYLTTERTVVQAKLNELFTRAFRTGFASLTDYSKQMQCADAVWSGLQRNIGAGPQTYGVPGQLTLRDFIFYDVGDADAPLTLSSDTAMYMFTEYSLVEVPFMWWLKCHLLSGIAPTADEGQVQCEAWTRFQQDTSQTSLVSLRMREYLQIYSPRFNEASISTAYTTLFQKQTNMLIEAHETVRNIVSNDEDIKPSCFTRQVSQNNSRCMNSLQFQRALFTIHHRYGTMDSVGEQECCDKGNEQNMCTPSLDLNTDPSTKDVLTSVHDFVQTQLSEQFLSINTDVLADEVIPKDLANNIDATEFPVFRHEWLLHEPGSGLSNFLAVKYSDAFTKGISECAVLNLPSLFEETSALPARCIFSNPQEDPFVLNNAFSDNTKPNIKPFVVLSSSVVSTIPLFGDAPPDKQTKKTLSYSRDKGIQAFLNVCGNQPTERNNAEGLTLSADGTRNCNLRHTTPFVCPVGGENPYNCVARERKPSPFERFQCFEQSSDCFLDDIHKNEFANNPSSQWRYAQLPPGVRIVTYGYPNRAKPPVIGRNSQFLKAREKLVWNNTFFSRNEMETSKAFGPLDGPVAGYVFSDSTTVYNRRRNLLTAETNAGGSDLATIDTPADNSTRVTSRNLLQADFNFELYDGQVCDGYHQVFYPKEAGAPDYPRPNLGVTTAFAFGIQTLNIDWDLIRFGWFDKWYVDERGERPKVLFENMLSCGHLQMGKDYDYIHVNIGDWAGHRCMPCAWKPDDNRRLKTQYIDQFHAEATKHEICKTSADIYKCCTANTPDGTKSSIRHSKGFMSCGTLNAEERRLHKIQCPASENLEIVERDNYLKCASIKSTFCQLKNDAPSTTIMEGKELTLVRVPTTSWPMVTWDADFVDTPSWVAELWNSRKRCQANPGFSSASFPCTMGKTLDTVAQYSVGRAYPSWYDCTGHDVQNIDPLQDNILTLDSLFTNRLYDHLFLETNAGRTQWKPTYREFLMRTYGDERGEALGEFAEKKEKIFKQFMGDFKNKWFDEYSTPTFRGNQDFALEAAPNRQTTSFWFPAIYKSFSLALLDGFTCDENACDPSKSTSMQIRKGMFHCVPCAQTPKGGMYCQGKHGCMVRNLRLRTNNANLFLSSNLASQVQQTDLDSLIEKHASTRMLSLSDTAVVLFLALNIEYRERLRSDPTVHQKASNTLLAYTPLLTYETPSNQIDWNHPSSWKFPVYSTIAAYSWQKTTGIPVYDPTVNKVVMQIGNCLEHSETEQVSYGQCSQDESLLSLKDGIRNAYNKTGGTLLHPSEGIMMPMHASQLLSDSLLGWSRHNRLLRDQYLEWLLSLENHCAQGKISESVCRVSTNGKTITLFNPWVGGDFSVAESCDVRRHVEGFSDVVDSAANRLCQTGGPLAAFFDSQVPSCAGKDGAPIQSRIVPKLPRPLNGAGVNLCNLSPHRHSSCTHEQSLLGGYRGRNVGTLYHPQKTLEQRALGGIFVQPRRPIFRRTSDNLDPLLTLEDSILKVDRNDIAGHHMRFVITDDDIMRVDELLLPGISREVISRRQEAVRLGSIRNPNPDFPRGGRYSWLDSDPLLESLQNVQHEPDLKVGPQHWTCPIRQRIFLSGMNARFRPRLPNGRRAQTMFAQHQIAPYRVNTVQNHLGVDVHVHADIRTSNGFCMCQHLEASSGTTDPYSNCRQSVQSNNDCSFLQTLSSLHDNTWRSSMVAKSFSMPGCVEQLDWPYTGGVLRDGRPMDAARMKNRTECNLLDRLPNFQYRYKYLPIPASKRDEDTLVSPHGNCHGSRVYSASAEEGLDFLSDACYPISASVNATHMELACTGKDTRTKYRKTLAVLRYKSKTEREAASNIPTRTQRPRAVRCAQCSAPPKFFGADGTTEIPPESSYGVPFRENPVRVIAGSIRNQLARSLCGSEGRECGRLERVLNVSTWVPELFWDAFLTNVSALFLEHSHSDSLNLLPNETVYSSLAQAAEEAQVAYDADLLLWNLPWVWCEQGESECKQTCNIETGVCEKSCQYKTQGSDPKRNIRRCGGTIPKYEWMDVSTRGKACSNKLTELQFNMNLTASVDVCDMNREMNSFCSVLQNARSEIHEANCLASGVCTSTQFFYQPSVYSLSNQEFIRSTVENFYLQINESSCPERSDALAKMLDQNDLLVRECSASALEAIVVIIQGLRSIVDQLFRILYITAMIIVTMLRFIIEGMTDFFVTPMYKLVNELEMYFRLWMKEMGALLEAANLMIYKFIMETEGGSFIRAIIEGSCELVNYIIQFFVFDVWCGSVSGTEWALRQLAEEVQNIPLLNLFNPSTLALADEVQKVFVKTCNPNQLLQCKQTYEAPEITIANLPVSTRCWSTYVNSLGDANSLSCSASDTCLSANLGGDGTNPKLVFSNNKELQMCGTCGTPTSGFTRFGCDLARKQCKCNVQTLVRTPCINHAECASTVRNDATCDMMDSSLTRNSFGNMPCGECMADPICLVGENENVGYCTCSMKQVEFATCSIQAIGESMYPAMDSLCLVTLGSAVRNDMSKSSEYATTYQQLAAARCDQIDQAQRYCMLVSSSAWDRFPLIVGMAGLQLGRRRLLSMWSFVVNADTYETALYAPDWGNVQYEACRSVPLLLGSDLSNYTVGIADKVLLESCVRWRAIGSEIVTALNLTGLPDTFLVSISDFTQTVVMHPNNLYLVFFSKPHTLLRALLHLEVMQPIRTMVRQFNWYVSHALVEAASVSASMNNTYITMNRTGLRGEFSGHARSVHKTFSRFEHIYQLVVRFYGWGVPQKFSNSSVPENFQDQLRAEMNGALMDFMDSAPFIPHRPPIRLNITNSSEYRQSEQNSSVAHSSEGESVHVTLRRMLQTSFIENIEAAKIFSAEIALGNGAIGVLNKKVVLADLTQPELVQTWPPTYVYWDMTDQCPVFENTWGVVARSSNLLYKFYTNQKPESKEVVRDIVSAFPDLSSKAYNISYENVARKALDGNSTFLEWAQNTTLSYGEYFGFTEELVAGIAHRTPDLLADFFTCDVEAVMFCSKQRVSLIASAIVVGVFTLLISLAMSYVLPSGIVNVVATAMFVATTMYYAFGVSPVCSPMVPTCVVDELVQLVDTVFPQSVMMPMALEKTPGCAEHYFDLRNSNTSVPNPADCVVQCSDEPFRFTDWYSNVAWFMCDFGLEQDSCDSAREWIQTSDDLPAQGLNLLWGTETTNEILNALWRSSVVLKSKDENMISAYRWCSVITSWHVAPYLFLLIPIVSVIPFLFVVLFSFFTGLLRVLLAILAMSHSYIKFSVMHSKAKPAPVQ